MKSEWRHVPVVILAVFLGAAPGLSASDYEGYFERTLKVDGPVEMDIATDSGNIDVRSGEPGSVRVRGTIRVSRRVRPDVAARKIQEIENNPPIEQTGNLIRVGYPKGMRRYVNIGDAWRHVSISYELIVPVETRWKSETGSGDQSVVGLKGPVKATTGSGNIRLSDVGDETRVDTGSGDIELRSVTGPVYARTGSGNIRASSIAGSIRAETGSGDLRLEQSSPHPASLETGSGTVELRGAQDSVRAQTGSGNIVIQGDPKGDWKLETGSGHVTLQVAPQASFTLHARTRSGGIATNIPMTIQGKVGGSELRGTVRNGGSLVDVRTGSGDIRIE